MLKTYSEKLPLALLSTEASHQHPSRIRLTGSGLYFYQSFCVTGRSSHRRFLVVLLSTLSIGLSSQPCRSQDAGSQAGQLWKNSQSAFASGNYAQAEASLESIIKLSGASTVWTDHTVVPPAPPKQQWLEPVFFMLAASYFDAKDWPNTIAVFNRYTQLFPRSSRLDQVNFSLAQAYMQTAQPNEAIPLLTVLLDVPDYQVKTLLLLVAAYKKADQPDQAIALLEKEKTHPNLNPNFLEKINVSLVPLYFDQQGYDKALVVLREMDGDLEHVADSTGFNSLAIKLGDTFLNQQDTDRALACYRMVRDNAQIIDLQQKQNLYLRSARAANLARIQADPLNTQQLQIDNKEIDAEMARNQDILAKYKTLPPILPPLYLRIARAYSISNRLWEATVVYREIMRRYPTCKEAESALYGSILLFDRLRQFDHGLTLCQNYLSQYPDDSRPRYQANGTRADSLRQSRIGPVATQTGGRSPAPAGNQQGIQAGGFKPDNSGTGGGLPGPERTAGSGRAFLQPSHG